MLQRALFLIACSYQTQYVDHPEQFVIPSGYGYQLVEKLATPSSLGAEGFGYIMENHDSIVIAFKGTSLKPFDISIDMDIYQTRFPWIMGAGKTHRGFTFLYGLLRKQIFSTLSNLAPTSSEKTIFLTGHSLGAALATLTAPDLIVNGPYSRICVSQSGSPRVGNPRFADAYNSLVPQSIRIANIHDYIPLNPISEIPPPFTEETISYSHVHHLFPISFQCNKKSTPLDIPLGRNHALKNYFNAVGLQVPDFAMKMCEQNPGFCPAISDDLCSLSVAQK
ncbi:triacylglycerol lipase [Croceifilum oryzae]|uniref:Triacylglycerol lipase n=1 Tax=Croceifilum oryzae TaxID=1553429 RepID=A0AAJ1TH57_9BACL|nr:lipase family protein [Croceifilum oryzae]MDQ0416902.1 triacylglycerol lipase [Croceifilum oryzae]